MPNQRGHLQTQLISLCSVWINIQKIAELMLISGGACNSKSSCLQRSKCNDFEIVSSIQVYLTSVVVHPGPNRFANPTVALQSSQQSAGNGTLCLLTSRIDLLPRTRSAWLLKGGVVRHPDQSSLHILPLQFHPISLFSFQRSIAGPHGIQRTVHRRGALSIELLQRQIALVLHYSSLLEVCDLYRD